MLKKTKSHNECIPKRGEPLLLWSFQSGFPTVFFFKKKRKLFPEFKMTSQSSFDVKNGSCPPL